MLRTLRVLVGTLIVLAGALIAVPAAPTPEGDGPLEFYNTMADDIIGDITTWFTEGGTGFNPLGHWGGIPPWEPGYLTCSDDPQQACQNLYMLQYAALKLDGSEKVEGCECVGTCDNDCTHTWAFSLFRALLDISLDPNAPHTPGSMPPWLSTKKSTGSFRAEDCVVIQDLLSEDCPFRAVEARFRFSGCGWMQGSCPCVDQERGRFCDPDWGDCRRSTCLQGE